VLKQILAPIRDSYPFILVDTPPSIGQLVINGLAAADHTIVTLDAGVFAVKGVGTLSTIFGDMASLGAPVRQEMAILTRWEGGSAAPDLLAQLAVILERLVDPRAVQQKEAQQARLEETRRGLEKQFARVFTVPLSMEVPQAQARGLPLSHVAPESPAGIAYRQIAEEVARWS
jgi:chromosome partitioning protein